MLRLTFWVNKAVVELTSLQNSPVCRAAAAGWNTGIPAWNTGVHVGGGLPFLLFLQPADSVLGFFYTTDFYIEIEKKI